MTPTDSIPTPAPIRELEGPVLAAVEVEIDARPEAVWATLTDFARWPEWNPEVKSVAVEPGEPAPGLGFRWKTGAGTIASTVSEVVPPARIVWKGRTLGIDAVHVWMIAERDGTVLVHTEESFSGPLAQLLRAPLRRTLKGTLDRMLGRLKAAAERSS